MPLNDAIAAVLEKVGLKKSEMRKCRDAILQHEERIKDLNDELSGKLAEAQRIEQSLLELKRTFDAASPASQKLLESQIRSAMNDFRGLKEMQDIVLRNLEKEKLLLRNRRIELEHLRHPTDVEAIVEAQDRKEEIVSNLKEEDVEVAELEGNVYRREDADRPATEDVASGAMLAREIDELLGVKTASVSEVPMDSHEDTPLTA